MRESELTITPWWPRRSGQWVTPLLLSFVAACSGRASTDGGSRTGSDGGADGGTVMIPVPGSAGDESVAGSSSSMSLTGPAAFDLDCGKDGALPEGDECSKCQISSCAVELAAALGNAWRSGAGDGPCRSWFNCIQACPCGDQACYKSCIPHLAESGCQQPAVSIDNCVMQNCASACSSSSQ